MKNKLHDSPQIPPPPLRRSGQARHISEELKTKSLAQLLQLVVSIVCTLLVTSCAHTSSIHVNLEEKLLAVIPTDLELQMAIFSPDGRHVAYLANKGNKEVVVIDGVQGEFFDHVSVWALIFSPDSQRFADITGTVTSITPGGLQ